MVIELFYRESRDFEEKILISEIYVSKKYQKEKLESIFNFFIFKNSLYQLDLTSGYKRFPLPSAVYNSSFYI